ncbi:MAG TPA: VOC family protein [Acidimicrobiales bacterium]|nr:VOC family protein [Acidimicrobiales bacterium]
MPIRSLGYVYWGTPQIEEWASFAESTLHLMPTTGPEPSNRYFRIDDRPYRLVLCPATAPGLVAVGYEVANDFELDELACELRSCGIDVETATDAEAANRRVSGLVRFRDPAGISVEVFYGPVLDHLPLDTPGNVEFVTGDMGMGHLVVGVADFEEAASFYRRVLGFELRNTMHVVRDGVSRKTYFLGCNPRHHSLAIAAVEVPGFALHLMVQVATIDDVGRAYDRCIDAGIPITMSLGRHTNDHMISFYCQGPDGLRVEYGYGGLRVEGGERLRTYEITRSSFWGHRPGGG